MTTTAASTSAVQTDAVTSGTLVYSDMYEASETSKSSETTEIRETAMMMNQGKLVSLLKLVHLVKISLHQDIVLG